jgi:cytochrome P450
MYFVRLIRCNTSSLSSELQDEDIIAQAVLFFLAGFDTASTLLCFASHQLAVHLDVQTRLQEEIDETLQENGGKFTYEALHNMKYLDMVVNGEKIILCHYVDR